MEKCPITNLPLKLFKQTSEECIYEINSESELISIHLEPSYDTFSKTLSFKNNVHLIAGAILNHQMKDGVIAGNDFYSIGANWEDKIPQITYPHTPKDKMDNLFKTFHKKQRYDGDVLEWDEPNPYLIFKHYFKNKDELEYYLNILINNNLIRRLNYISPIQYFQITYDGLNYFNEITESGQNSNKCFVAMSFGPKTKDIREAIRAAIKATDFDPIIIDEIHIDSDNTINDAIIAELKGSKFCIADFTQQRHGVYFECGFALGQGKPVIYCCNKTDFRKSHFDTKHFAHIIYGDPSELKEGLINKIKAWIR